MSVATKERPILFTGEMVRAILDGKKTQTRRVERRKVRIVDGSKMFIQDVFTHKTSMHKDAQINCPYGIPGDRLWVRETWATGGSPSGYSYKADSETWKDRKSGGPDWRSPMFMFRRSSRITLEIVNVRIERVQDLSEDDAQAEGIRRSYPKRWFFGELWDSINAKRGYGWDVNPWVWVIEFKRVK